MLKFIEIQYRLNNISRQQLLNFVGNKITAAQYNVLIGEKYEL